MRWRGRRTNSKPFLPPSFSYALRHHFPVCPSGGLNLRQGADFHGRSQKGLESPCFPTRYPEPVRLPWPMAWSVLSCNRKLHSLYGVKHSGRRGQRWRPYVQRWHFEGSEGRCVLWERQGLQHKWGGWETWHRREPEGAWNGHHWVIMLIKVTPKRVKRKGYWVTFRNAGRNKWDGRWKKHFVQIIKYYANTKACWGWRWHGHSSRSGALWGWPAGIFWSLQTWHRCPVLGHQAHLYLCCQALPSTPWWVLTSLGAPFIKGRTVSTKLMQKTA